MAFKPNYRHERAERDRAKKAKKEEKLQERLKRAEQRTVPDEPSDADSGAESE